MSNVKRVVAKYSARCILAVTGDQAAELTEKFYEVMEIIDSERAKYRKSGADDTAVGDVVALLLRHWARGKKFTDLNADGWELYYDYKDNKDILMKNNNKDIDIFSF